ncbi:MFS transporter [Actinocorallia longicatena]|uniref:MFS transporter n=1 Tax=Actinocorallia longicatena TaxID=111803 RepID=A0ABP6QIG4_9ACTN
MHHIGRARLAVAAIFTVHGAAAGTFATRIPWIKDHVHASAGGLGLALLAPAMGSILAMPMVGRLIHRIGGRTATRVFAALFCLVLALVPFAPNLLTLWFCLLLFGATAGSCDVAMNAQGVEVEQALGRSIMSGLHGMWSVGGLLGAAAGTLAAHADLDARIHLPIAAAVLVAAGYVIGFWLPESRAAEDVEEPPHFALPGKAVLGIGFVSFCAVFAEGAAADWCAVYLKDVAHAGAGVSASAYTAFALMMAASRLAGDAVVSRLGAVRTVRIGGFLSIVGGVLVVLARTPLPAIIGFGLIGLGIAVVVPLAFAAAGKAAANAGQGVAGVATITYSCLLVAPAIIGGLASITSLSLSFVIVTVMTVLMTATAGKLRVADAKPIPA